MRPWEAQGSILEHGAAWCDASSREVPPGGPHSTVGCRSDARRASLSGALLDAWRRFSRVRCAVAPVLRATLVAHGGLRRSQVRACGHMHRLCMQCGSAGQRCGPQEAASCGSRMFQLGGASGDYDSALASCSASMRCGLDRAVLCRRGLHGSRPSTTGGGGCRPTRCKVAGHGVLRRPGMALCPIFACQDVQHPSTYTEQVGPLLTPAARTPPNLKGRPSRGSPELTFAPGPSGATRNAPAASPSIAASRHGKPADCTPPERWRRGSPLSG